MLETDRFGNFIITGYDFLSAYDWARFGLLHLWDGVWEGERLLPEGWAEFVSAPAPADPSRSYGGLFWVNEGGRFPSLPRDAYTAAGFMGQNTVIIPSLDLVVVRLGPSPGGSDRYLDRVIAGVIEALGLGGELEASLRDLARKGSVVETEDSSYGRNYVVEGTVSTPVGRRSSSARCAVKLAPAARWREALDRVYA